MFSMTKIKAVNGAGKAFYANHLAANDYYSEKEKVIGIWSGSLAFDFDLLGKRVDTETFSLFQQNINPLTLSKLTQSVSVPNKTAANSRNGKNGNGIRKNSEEWIYNLTKKSKN